MTVVIGFQASAEGSAALVAGIAEAALRQTEAVVLLPEGMQPETFVARHDVAATASGGSVRLTTRTAARDEAFADELIELATEVAGDLIVIGLRRRSSVGKFLLGSIAQRVLLDAHVPVLAVHAAG